MHILWVDLETSGLDPKNDGVLEVAAILTEGPELVEVDSLTAIVPHNPERVARACNGHVLRMHAKSGLLGALKTPAKCGPPLPVIDSDLAGMVLKHTASGKPPMLGGSSVHFDRSFMKVHLPVAEKVLSHRNFDTSTLIAAEKLAGFPEPEEEREVMHRALDDIQWSLKKAREFVRRLRITNNIVGMTEKDSPR